MTSTVHSDHPPVQEAGLADGCPACAEIALDPTAHLDDETLGQLATLATATDRLARGRSETELVAAAYVLSTLERVGRLANAAPHVVAWYLREKWSLDVQLDGRAPLPPGAAEVVSQVSPEAYERVSRALDLAAPVSAMLAAGTAPQRIHELVDAAVDEFQNPTDAETLLADPVCECNHRLSEHREEDGPGHAGCRAQVVVEGADSEKGEDVYAECDCAGFVSRDLAEQEQQSGGIAADYAESAE